MRLALLALAISLTGCATLADDYPAASVPSAPAGGQWSGVATGRDMATTLGVMSEGVKLAIDDSGHYTLIHKQGTGEIRSSGTVSVSGNRLILDGSIEAPRALAGAPVRHYVWRTNDGLAGTIDTFFLGHRVHPQLLLESRP